MENKETTTYKHRNCIIELTPTEQHTEMVTITKTPAVRKDFEGRRYLTLGHAHKQIEQFESERLIKSKENYVKKQLAEVVVIEGQGFHWLVTK
jgi:hypothetical protein